MTKMAAMPTCGKISFKKKSLYLEPEPTWYAAWGTLEYLYINHDLGLTLAYFMAWSNLATWAFEWSNVKT